MSNVEKKVKWGVLGTASIAHGCTIPGMLQADNCELYAIAGRNMAKAEAFKAEFGFEAAYGDYESLLNDANVEAVYIPLPNDLHYEWVMKAIKAGKHILCEKPIVPTKKQAEELFKAAKEKGVLLMEAFAYLHSPYVLSLKKDLESGIIGDVEYIESAFLTQGYDLSNIRMYKDKFGGAMYDLGCYCISLILWLIGRKPEKIKGLAEFTDLGVDSFSTAYMEFPGKASSTDTSASAGMAPTAGPITASIRCGMNLGTSRPGRMDYTFIYGTKGYIKSGVEYNQEGDLQYKIYTDDGEIVRNISAKKNYRLEVEQLGRCILEGEKPHVSEDFSLLEAEVLEEAIKAIGY